MSPLTAPLGGFSRAILLGVVAVLMLVQFVERFFESSLIHYNEAIAIAALGLLVNLLCACLLRGADHHHHGHGHGHDHDHHHGHHDVNLRSAYIHVIADAATSVLAIVALLGGKFYGASWLDPVMGVAGSVLVARWAIGLLKESGKILLDAEMDSPVVQEVRDVIEQELPQASITDLHLCQRARRAASCRHPSASVERLASD
jgi:cation diffusion facilitator family transporter